MTTIKEAARAWYEAGASVLPAQRGKRPIGTWQEYQLDAARWDDLNWEGVDGLGLVTGYGGFTMLEIEGDAMELLPQLAEKLANAGYLSRLMKYMEQTPSGGIHWIYRLTDPPETQDGSQKLASRPIVHEDGRPGLRTMIETRGRFAWVVVAPSGGSIHQEIPDGRWEVKAGRAGEVPEFTEQEIESIYDICREFDQSPAPMPSEHPSALPVAPGGVLTPGQDYNARNTWEDVLEPLGWKHTPGRGPGFWTRPGKQWGVSADITPSDNLWVFSSSCYPLEQRESYTKFKVYSLYNHNGDDSAAARELRRLNYGTPLAATTVGPDDNVVILADRVRNVPEPPDASRPAEPLAEDADELTGEEQSLAESDDGLAIVLRRRYEDKIRYCPDRGRWLTWTGKVWEWQPVGGGLVCEFHKRIARGLPGTEKHEIRWKQMALGSKTLGNVIRMAQTDPALTVNQADLDARPDELNTPTGIVLMKTGELIPHDPARLHTKITLVGPDPSWDSTLWDDFMAQTFAGDMEMIDFMARLVGVSASGYSEPHILPFCSGTGGNGKGVFVETMMALLHDYATAAPPNFLMVGPARHLTEMADLQGRRLVVASEVNEDDKFDEAKMKRLTGGDKIKANFMRQDMFSFDPSHHLWLVGNHRPTMTSATTNDSVWRRVKEIKFVNEVPEEDRIDGLKERLVAECGPAIMAWIVKGAADYFGAATGAKRGELAIPTPVEAATADYRSEADTVTQFLSERCHIGGGTSVTTPKDRIYVGYTEFCREIGEDPSSHKAFTKALQRKGLMDGRNTKFRFWYGLTLLAAEDEEPIVRNPPDHPWQQRL